MRLDGRKFDEMRKITFHPNYLDYPEGSVLVTLGSTKVICSATIEESVPRWMQSNNVQGGWITSEYSLLPRSTHKRSPRELHGFSARTQEIRRLIGRALRAAIDLSMLNGFTCIIDCDVIQADGSTRVASISGGYLALVIALNKLVQGGVILDNPIKSIIAAVSVGVVNEQIFLDLSYEEDHIAEVDMNITMNSESDFIEIQGTAEGVPFSKQTLDVMLELASHGINDVIYEQRKLLFDLGIELVG